MCFLTRASASGGTGSLFLIHFNPRFREGSDTNMYNFLVYICKSHSTTYKLIIIFLFHSVKQINYSYWKTCESSRLVKYTYNIDQISSTTEFQSTASSQKATGISYRQYAYRFKFQSTSSSQKATNAIHPVRYAYKISIHSFLAESDLLHCIDLVIFR